MRIIAYECKKAFTSPVLLALIFVFSCFNIFLIIGHSYSREELKVVNHLAGTYGVQITDETMNQFQQEWQNDLVKLNEITAGHTNENFNSIYEFSETLRYEDFERYSEVDRTFFAELELKEMYYNLAMGIDERYNGVDWKQIGEGEITKYGLSGSLADYFRYENTKLIKRVEEIKQTDAHRAWFFAGVPYHMHSFLFRTLFAALIFEALMLTVLATTFITNYEFENRTHLVMYTTKKGRRLKKNKFFASMITTAVMTAFLFIVTLGVYFTVFDYSHLWGSFIGSALNWEYKLPYVPWWNMSFLSFILWSMALVLVCIVLFNILTFAVSVLVRNNYFTFFLMAAFFSFFLIVPLFMPSLFGLETMVQFNMSQLLMNPHQFFMGNVSIPIMVQYYELMTVLAWLIIAFAFTWLALRVFNVQDIN